MSDIITDVLDVTRENCDDIKAFEELDEMMQFKYGISYNEYMTMRNSMLKEYNGELPRNIFDNAISQFAVNKALMGLMAKGMLNIGTNLNFQVNEKGINALASREVEEKKN